MTNEEAINVLKNTAWLGTENDREEVKKALETLSNTSEIPNSSDMINRQAAIDEWKNDFKGYVNALNIPRDDYNGIMAYIDELPSAQQEPQWIPCSERLPEKNRKPNTFLVADSDGKLSISKFYFPLSNSDIEKPYWSGMIDVVAWMPLPEPYKDA